MDLQTRKLNFIQDFLKLKNEKVISLFEELMLIETQTKSALKPMTLKEFKKRINESIVDATSERLTENSKLIGEIEKWS
jgi:hypothetical protein